MILQKYILFLYFLHNLRVLSQDITKNYLIKCNQNTNIDENDPQYNSFDIISPIDTIDEQFINNNGITDYSKTSEINVYLFHQNYDEVCDLKLIELKDEAFNIIKFTLQSYNFNGESDYPDNLIKLSQFNLFVFYANDILIEGIQVQDSTGVIRLHTSTADNITYRYIQYQDNEIIVLKQEGASNLAFMHDINILRNQMEQFDCQTWQHNSNKTIMRDMLFKDNLKNVGQWYGSTMVSSNQDSLIQNVQYIDSIGYEQLTITYQSNTYGVIDNLLVQGCEGWKEMLLIRNNGIVEIQNSVIDGNSLDTTSIMLFSKNEHVIINDTLFENNVQDVGLGRLLVNVLFTQKYTLTNLTFRDNNILGIAGCIFIQESNQGVMENIEFYRNTAIKSGTAVYLQQGNQLEVKNCKFYNNNPLITEEESFNAQGLFYATRYSDIKFLGENKFEDNRGILDSSIYLSECDDFYLENGLFQKNNYFSGVNGITILSSVNITIIDSKFLDSNSPDKYGSINLYDGNQNILIRNCEFSNQHVQSLVGVINIFKAYNITIQDSSFLNNSANIMGVMLVEKTDIININNCQFNQNKAGQTGVMKILDSTYVNIQNSDFKNNTSDKDVGGVTIQSCYGIKLQDISMTDNKVGYNKGALEIYFSDGEIVLNNINFENNVAEKETGGALFLGENKSQMLIQNSIFKNNFAGSQGGGIKIERQEYTILENVQFIQNQALDEGGAIEISKSGKLNIKGSQFLQNYSEKQGSGIFLSQTEQLLIEDESNFEQHQSCKQGGVLYGDQITDIQIQDSTFQNNAAMIEAGVFYFLDCQNLQIKNSIIKDNKAYVSGGAGILNNIENIDIQSSQIENNQIQKVERIKVDEEKNQDYVQVFNSLELEILKFQQVGGAINAQNSNNFTIYDSQFKSNSAKYLGGGLFLSDIKNLIINQSKFLNNQVNFNEGLSLNQKNQDYLLTQGGAIYLEQINNDEEYRKFKIIDSQFNENQASSGGSLLLYNSQVTLQTLYINNLKCLDNKADHGPCIRFIGPNTKNITQSLDEIPESSMKNEAFISQSHDNIYEFQPNEKKNSETDYRITLCPPGTFLKQGGELICQKCIDNGVCQGGYIPTYPDEEYWREDEKSMDFIYCNRNPKACLGNDTCADGYIGLKCENCDSINGYAKSDSVHCAQCQEQGLVILKFIILFVVVILAIGNQIYGAISKAEKIHTIKNIRILQRYPLKFKNITTGLVNLIIMHCQILSLVSSLTLQMPTFLQSTLAIFGNPQQVLSSSIECLYNIEGLEQLVQQGQELHLYGLLILFCALIVIILFLFVRYFRPSKIKLYEYRQKIFSFFVCAVICFLLMIQPGMLFNSAAFITCKTVGTNSYNSADTNLRCDDDFFLTKVLPINISIIIFIGFLFPLYIIWNLRKGSVNSKLESIFFTRKFALLFINSKQKYYYWDFLLMMEKIVIVLVATLLQEEVLLKGIIIIFIIQVYLQISNKLQPFVSLELNKYYNYLCCIQIVTIIGSIIIEQYSTQYEDGNAASQVVQVLCLIVILGLNGLFLLNSGRVLIKEVVENYKFFIMKNFPNFAKKSKILKQHEAKMKAIKHWIILQKGIRGKHENFWQNTQQNNENDISNSIYNDQSASNYFKMKHSQHMENDQMQNSGNQLQVNNYRGKKSSHSCFQRYGNEQESTKNQDYQIHQKNSFQNTPQDRNSICNDAIIQSGQGSISNSQRALKRNQVKKESVDNKDSILKLNSNQSKYDESKDIQNSRDNSPDQMLYNFELDFENVDFNIMEPQTAKVNVSQR